MCQTTHLNCIFLVSGLKTHISCVRLSTLPMYESGRLRMCSIWLSYTWRNYKEHEESTRLGDAYLLVHLRCSLALTSTDSRGLLCFWSRVAVIIVIRRVHRRVFVFIIGNILEGLEGFLRFSSRARLSCRFRLRIGFGFVGSR